jgi:hypothetical protein
MPIEAEAFDGTVLEFPDGTSDDVIRSAVMKYTQQAKAKQPNFGFSERFSEGEGGEPARRELSGSSLAQGRVLNALQGATFNFADEILPYTTAGLDEVQRLVTGKLPEGANVPFDQRVDYYRNQARALGSRMMEERPIESVGTQLAGGLATGGAALTRAATGIIGRAAPTTAAALRAGSAGLGARAAQGGVAGSLGGVIAGAGGGTDLESRIQGAGVGGVLGGVLGGSLPVAASGLGAAGRTIQSYVAPSTVNAEARAAEVLGQAVGRSQLGAQAQTPGAALANMQQGGIQNATLADLSDELTALTGAVARSPGRGRQIVGDFLRARQEGDPTLGAAGGGQWADILDDISAKVSPSVSAKRAADAIIADRAKQAKPLYDEAFKVGDIISDGLTSLGKIPAMRSAIQRGVNMAKQEGSLPADFKLDLSKPLPIQVWHQAKQGIDDLIGAATRSGEKGQARSLIAMQQRLLDEMDTLTGGLYGQARQNFAGNSAMLNALESGKNILQRATTAEDIADNLAKLTSQSEIQAFRAGAAQALRDTVARTGRKGNAAAKFLNRGDIQQKLQALFDNPDDYQDFMARMAGRDRLYRTYSELGGSPTQQRMVAGDDLEASISGGAAPENLLTAAALGGRQAVGRSILQRLQDGPVRFLGERVREKVAEMLTTNDPAQIRRAVQVIQAAAERAQRAQLRTGAAQAGIVQGAAVQPVTSGR